MGCDEGQDTYFEVLGSVMVCSREVSAYSILFQLSKRIGSSLELVWRVFILVKWPWNLAKIVLLVWPTYCLPHVVQLMQLCVVLRLGASGGGFEPLRKCSLAGVVSGTLLFSGKVQSAYTTRSLRFFGLLYPTMIFIW